MSDEVFLLIFIALLSAANAVLHLHQARLNGFKLHSILKGLRTMATELDAAMQRVTDAISRETTVDQSILALVTIQSQQIKTLSDELAAGTIDVPGAVAKLNGFADAMTANADQISAAVTANTPAAPPEPPAV